LLKNTGAGKPLMVSGEPMSGPDRPRQLASPDRNGDSFFARHAYFTGADDPYENLEKALRPQIDRDVWASLNSTVTRRFPQPATGWIAFKGINHYGDDVVKVYEL
jgi:adenine-specific DNA-methyltransferase